MDSDTMEKGNEFTYVNNVKEEEDDMNDSSLSTDEGPDDEPELTSDEKPAASSKAKAKAKPKPKTTKVNGGTALKKNGKKGAAAVTSEESPEKKARSGQIDKLGLAIEVARAEGKVRPSLSTFLHFTSFFYPLSKVSQSSYESEVTC